MNVLDGYSTNELAVLILGSARRWLTSDENPDTMSARRSIESVFRQFYAADERTLEAKDEAQRLVEVISGARLDSLEVLIAAEAIMTERSK